MRAVCVSPAELLLWMLHTAFCLSWLLRQGAGALIAAAAAPRLHCVRGLVRNDGVRIELAQARLHLQLGGQAAASERAQALVLGGRGGGGWEDVWWRGGGVEGIAVREDFARHPPRPPRPFPPSAPTSPAGQPHRRWHAPTLPLVDVPPATPAPSPNPAVPAEGGGWALGLCSRHWWVCPLPSRCRHPIQQHLQGGGRDRP